MSVLNYENFRMCVDWMNEGFPMIRMNNRRLAVDFSHHTIEKLRYLTIGINNSFKSMYIYDSDSQRFKTSKNIKIFGEADYKELDNLADKLLHDKIVSNAKQYGNPPDSSLCGMELNGIKKPWKTSDGEIISDDDDGYYLIKNHLIGCYGDELGRLFFNFGGIVQGHGLDMRIEQ